MFDERSRLQCNIEVARDFYLARLQAPRIAARVRPGQFVALRVSRRISPFLRLPLSVYRTRTGEGVIELLYEDRGPKSRALSRLRPGTELSCLGPLGRGFSPPAAAQRVLLVGGGIGLPPLLFLGELLRRDGGAVALLAGARTASRHLPDTLLRPAAQVLSRATDDGSAGHGGPVTELLQRELEADPRVVVCTCGPHAMMAAVAALCRRHGVACQASLEEYMACGYGVCVGCVVEILPGEGEETSPYLRYRRVCVEGPVFDAHRVCWGNDGGSGH